MTPAQETTTRSFVLVGVLFRLTDMCIDQHRNRPLSNVRMTSLQFFVSMIDMSQTRNFRYVLHSAFCWL